MSQRSTGQAGPGPASSGTDDLRLVDVTLREGQQTAEVAFSTDEEVTIARGLARVGVPVIQTGYAGDDDDSLAQIRAAVPGSTQLSVLLVGWQDEAVAKQQSAFDHGADVCVILFRSTDKHIANLGFTRSEAIARITDLASRARRAGWKEILFAPSYATRADQEFLFEMYRAVIDAGATVIGYSDSLGEATPARTAEIVGQMRETGAAVRVHMHNDYGLALANSIAGVQAGATWVDVSVNGLGERAGNCATDEAAVALERLYGYRTGVALDGLYELSRLVAGLSGVTVPPMKPLVGDNCFTNKLDIHVKAALSDPSLMEPFPPELVGNHRRIDLGRRSGPVATGYKARSALGIELTDDEAGAVAALVNVEAARRKGLVDDETLRELIGQVRQGGGR